MYLTVSTQNPSDLAVYQYRDGGFAKLGNSIAGETVGAAATAAAGDMLYVAYCSEQGNVRIKTYRLRQDSVTGDVNGDGACTVADAVLLGTALRSRLSKTRWILWPQKNNKAVGSPSTNIHNRKTGRHPLCKAPAGL